MIHPLESVDRKVSTWMATYGIQLLRISVAIIFIWFGLLKPLGLSEANELATRTIYWVFPSIFIPVLGVWEILIGICLLIRPLTRVAILLLFLQMLGTLLPLVLLPEICWQNPPWVPTMEGQYVLKNLVIISAGIVIGGTVRRSDDACAPSAQPN